MERTVEYTEDGLWRDGEAERIEGVLAAASVISDAQVRPLEGQPAEQLAALQAVVNAASKGIKDALTELKKFRDTKPSAKSLTVRVITMHPEDDHARRLLNRHTLCIRELSELREQLANSEDEEEQNRIKEKLLDAQIEADQRARDVLAERVTMNNGETDLWSICNERNKLADRLLDAAWGFPSSG